MATVQQVNNALRVSNLFDIYNPTSPINISVYEDITDWTALGILASNGDTVDIICKVISPIGGVPYENAGFATNDFSAPDMTLTSSTANDFTLPTFTGTNNPINGAYQYIFKVRVIQGSSGQINTSITQNAGVSQKQITTSTLSGTIAVGDVWTATYSGVSISYTIQLGDDLEMAAVGLVGEIQTYRAANPSSDWSQDIVQSFLDESVLFTASTNNTPFTLTCTYTQLNPYTLINTEKTFLFDLPKDVNPTLTLTETWDCATATYKSVDTSNYCFNGCANGYSVTEIERTHIVYPPIASNQNSVSADAETILLGAPDNQLWTGTYQITLSVIVTLVKGDCTIITRLSTNTEQTVVCDDLLCNLYCSLKKLYTDFKYNLGINSAKANQIQSALLKGTFAYNMAKQARLCSDETRVAQYVNDFYDWTGADPNCDCCKDENSPVVPTSVINGADGQNGLTPEFRVESDLFQSRYPGGGWTTLYDFSTIVGLNGLSFIQGSGVPSNADGVNGDSYLDSDTGDVYLKTAGVWVLSFNIKGADGAAGQDGAAVLYNSVTDSTTSTNALELLKTYVLPAAKMANDDILQIKARFTVPDSDNAFKLACVYFNGVPILASLMQGNTKTVILEASITRTGATTAKAYGVTFVSNFSGTASAAFITSQSSYTPTWANTINVQAYADDAGGYPITCELFQVIHYKKI